jgi:NAD(P)-dependent dehydrogenase (short-subunit alcohol dehydrogenase family)
MHIQGAIALVTGGASGLGEATVRRLIQDGAARVVIADLNAEKGQALAAELGERARFAQTDITQPDQVSAAIALAEEAGPLRVAINCAGIAIARRLLSRDNQPHDLESFRKIVEVNLIGTFNVLRLASARMAAAPALDGGDSERGVVINTASVAAYDGQIGQVAYAASKGGIVGLTLPAARDLSAVGVRVLTIAPGIFNTPLLAVLPEAAKESLAKNIPFPARLGDPAEFANLIAAIVTTPYLNGEVIRIDGSLRMAPK